MVHRKNKNGFSAFLWHRRLGLAAIILIIILAINIGREIVEAELGHVFLNRRSQLQRGGDIEAIVQLGSDKIEIALLIDVTGLFDLGSLDDQGALQRHAVVDLPVMHQEGLIAYLLDGGVGIRERSQTAEGSGDGPGRCQYAELQ